jgi:hypothetical protein
VHARVDDGQPACGRVQGLGDARAVGVLGQVAAGAGHWFTAQIVSWAIANKVTEAAITDG